MTFKLDLSTPLTRGSGALEWVEVGGGVMNNMLATFVERWRLACGVC